MPPCGDIQNSRCSCGSSTMRLIEMNNDWILTEMFGDVNLTDSVLPEELPEIKLHDPKTAGAANGMVRRLMYNDLLEKVIGQDAVFVPPPFPSPGKPVT